MFGIGTGELLLILVIVLVIFGGKRIPELARSLGKGLREFRKAKDELHDALDAEADADAVTQVKTENPPRTLTPPADKRHE